MADSENHDEKVVPYIRLIPLVLSLLFVPGAIPAGIVIATQRYLANSKLLYAPLVMLVTIFFLSGVAS